MNNDKWYEVLDEFSDSFDDFLPKNTILIGYVNDEDADYSHTEHRFYKTPDKFVYIYSSGCSCWGDEDAADEWTQRIEFDTRDQLIKYVNSGDYNGSTIHSSIKKEIIETLNKIEPYFGSIPVKNQKTQEEIHQDAMKYLKEKYKPGVSEIQYLDEGKMVALFENSDAKIPFIIFPFELLANLFKMNESTVSAFPKKINLN